MKDIVIPKPKDWQRFERLCADLFAAIWQCPHTQLHGRSGQPQAGVDVFARLDAGWYGVQCKGRNGDYATHAGLDEKTLRAEVENAKKFSPKLSCFILATTAPNSQDIQAVARSLTDFHRKRDLFDVYVYAWEELERRLADHETIAQAHGLLPRPRDAESALSPSGILLSYSQTQLDRAIEFYSTALLRTYDALDLGELGGIDSEMARERLALRQLYIPLTGYTAPQGATSGTVFQSFFKLRSDLRDHDVWSGDGGEDDMPLPGYVDDLNDVGSIDTATEDQAPPNRDVIKPLSEQLVEQFRLVVLADPGAGKTTFVRWVATCALLGAVRQGEPASNFDKLFPAPYLPILIPCRLLDKDVDVQSVGAAVFRALDGLELAPDILGAAYCAVWERISRGDAVLLIDGLDEITDVRRRQCFVSQLETFSRIYRNVPILVTSRIYGYAELGSGLSRDFGHAMIAELDVTQKDEFAEKWSRLTELPENVANSCDRLKDAYRSSARVARLSSNPLMLTTLALVLRKHGSIPERRCKLYEEGFDLLLRWRARTDVRMDSREALRRLAYLAYRMTDEGRQRVREDEIVRYWDEMNETLPRFRRLLGAHSHADYLAVLERRSAILVNIGRAYHDGDLSSFFEFRHLSFQDYLAGRAIGLGCYPDGRENNVASKLSEMSSAMMAHDNAQLRNRWAEPIRLCISALDEIGGGTEENIGALLADDQQHDDEALRRAIFCLDVFCDEPTVTDEFARRVFARFARVAGACSKTPEYAAVAGPEDHVDLSFIPQVRSIRLSAWGAVAEEVIPRRLIENASPIATSHLMILRDLWWSHIALMTADRFQQLWADAISCPDAQVRLLKLATLVRWSCGRGYCPSKEYFDYLLAGFGRSELHSLAFAFAVSGTVAHNLSTHAIRALLEASDEVVRQDILVELMNMDTATIHKVVNVVRGCDDMLKYLAAVMIAPRLWMRSLPWRWRTYVTSSFVGDFASIPFSAQSYAELVVRQGMIITADNQAARMVIDFARDTFGWSF